MLLCLSSGYVAYSNVLIDKIHFQRSILSLPLFYKLSYFAFLERERIYAQQTTSEQEHTDPIRK